MPRLSVEISDDLHQRLKVAAAQGRRTIKDIVTDYIEGGLQGGYALHLLASMPGPGIEEAIHAVQNESRTVMPDEQARTAEEISHYYRISEGED